MTHVNYRRTASLGTMMLLFISLMIFGAGQGLAQDTTKPGRLMISAAPVTPANARTILDLRQVTTPYTPTTGVPVDIVELARGLRNDPDLIYSHIHDTIEFVLGYGAVKGPLGTLLDGSGNAFDQAALMVTLLRQAGYTASYGHGTIRLSAQELSNWLGLPVGYALTAETAGEILGTAGVPAETSPVSGALNYVDIDHVWVKVDIGGTDYVFDPSFKTHTYTAPIDFAAAMNYDRTGFLTQAQTGSTINVVGDQVTDDYSRTQDINKANIDAALTTYASNLIDYIGQNHPDADMKELTGDTRIDLAASMVRQTSLPYQQTVAEEWTGDIPDNYQTVFTVSHTNFTATFRSADVYGRRLTIENDFNTGVLRLDGVDVANGQLGSTGLTVSVDHPYAAENEDYGDQTGTITQIFPGFTFILNSWGETNRGMIYKHRHILRDAQQAGETEESEIIRGENLGLVAYNYAAEASQADRLAAKLTRTRIVNHHTFGVVTQRLAENQEHVFMDLGLCRSSLVNLDGNDQRAKAVFLSRADRSGILESGIGDQVRAPWTVSTAKLIDLANNDSLNVIKVTPANWTHVQTALGGCCPNLAVEIDELVTALDPWHVIVPMTDEMTEGEWTGQGILAVKPDGDNIRHIIDGRKGGAFGPFDSPWWMNRGEVSCTSRSMWDGKSDPIGMEDGVFFKHYEDISFGEGEPAGLSFHRSYFSKSRLQDSGLGYGWGHNYSSSVAVNTDAFKGLGEHSPIPAAAAVAAMYAAADALEDARTIDRMVIVSIVNNWLMAQLTDNVVELSFPGATRQFIRLPNGDYSAPSCCSPETLIEEPDGSFLLITKNGVEYDFDVDGKLITKTDLNGNTLTLTYTEGLLTSVANSFGRSFTITYNNGRIDGVSGPGGRSVSYGYDANGRLTGFTDAEGHTTTFEYDDKNRLTQIFNPSHPASPAVTNTYDDLDRVKYQSIAGSAGYAYYYSGYRTEQIDPLGRAFVWQYDPDWHFNKPKLTVSLTDPLDRQTTMTYDGQDRLKEKILPEGNSESYTYDEKGNLLSVSRNPKTTGPSLTTTYTYHPVFNKRTTMTDPMSRTTTFVYDPANGNLLRMEQPQVEGQTPATVFTYYANGLLETTTDPSGLVTSYGYNAQGDLTSTGVDPAGLNLTTTYGRDDSGNMVGETDPRGNTTAYVYDDQRQVTNITMPAPLSYETIIGYDPDGRVNSVQRQIDAVNWQNTSSVYSVSGKVLTETHANGESTTYTYDQLDRLYTETDPEGRVTIHLHDELDRPFQVKDGNQDLIQEWTYTPNGLEASVKDGNNNVTTFEYDDYDRLVRTIYPDTSFEQLTLDDAGNVTQLLTRGGETITMVHDDLNRLTSRTVPGSGTETYDYDLAGRIESVSGPGGSIQHGHDTAKRLTGVTFPGSRTVSYEYDAASNRNKLTYPDSSYVTYTYDEMNRLTGILDSGANTLAAYTYDGLSRVTRLDYGNGTFTEYTHTPLDRPDTIHHQQWIGGDVQLGYGYDRAGLQTSFTTPDSRFETLLETGGRMNPSVNNLNQYTTFDQTTLIYTRAGNLESDGIRFFTYDAANRLLSETAPGVSFTYDPFDRRATKTISGGTTTFIYDDDEVIAEYDELGQLVRKYVCGPIIDHPVLMETSGQKYYFHTDSLGSVMALTDSGRNVVETYQYTVYGKPNQASALGNPYQYTGRRWDPETGLYFYRARFYDPDLRRFIQPDPIGYIGGMNLYAYVGNSPLNMTDPHGRFFILMAAVGAGVGYTAAMMLGDVVIVSALSLALHNAVESHYSCVYRGRIDREIFKKNKIKFSKSKKYRQPKQEDPKKDPPPNLDPTYGQQSKHEPWYAWLWRWLTSPWTDH